MTDILHASLAGVRVVALAMNIPGPLAAARLSRWGASVVKIESPNGDPLAQASPGWYAGLHATMRVERLDLRAAADLETLHAHLRDADLLITAMRASALARIGLEWAVLHERYPGLSHVAVVGEGPPYDDRAGHDLTYQARAGLLSPPAMPRTVLADLAAAERAVSSALAALLQRNRTGEGVRVGVAIVDAAIEFGDPLRHGLTGSTDVLGGALPTYDLYRASDGWIAVAALEPHFGERLAAMLEVESLDRATLQARFATRRAIEWEELAAARDVPLAAVI